MEPVGNGNQIGTRIGKQIGTGTRKLTGTKTSKLTGNGGKLTGTGR